MDPENCDDVTELEEVKDTTKGGTFEVRGKVQSKTIEGVSGCDTNENRIELLDDAAAKFAKKIKKKYPNNELVDCFAVKVWPNLTRNYPPYIRGGRKCWFNVIAECKAILKK